MSRCRVTIIVPIYNLENYIPTFFKDLEKQTFQSFKIIAIDDFSSDNSLNMLLDYKEKHYLKIVVLNNSENLGPGLTKDVGLDSGFIEGDYVLFLDGDDRFEADFLEKMVENADESNADITVCGFDRFDDKSGEVYSKEMVNNHPDYIVNLTSNDKFAYINPSLWNKLYRRDLIKDLHFSNVKRGEDLIFLLYLFPRIQSIKFINEILIHYRVRYGSLINTTSEMSFDIFLNDLINLKKYYLQLNNNKQYIEILELVVFIHLGISYTYRLASNDRKKKLYYIKNTKDCLDRYFPGWRKNRYLNIKHCVFGGSKKIGLWGCRLLYKINMFGVFIKVYLFIIEKLKIDIKW